MRGCRSPQDLLVVTDFGKPLPWIGLYIAAASFLCFAAMASDVFFAFRHRKLWFPCRFFSLNAITLVILSIVTKLAVDISTPMPLFVDQLCKLSGTVLLCTALGNLLPSIGDMNSSEILPNVVALCILVVTVIVNVGMQINTGAIYTFPLEHVIVISILILLLLIFVSSAIAVPCLKENLETVYERKFREMAIDSQEKDVDLYQSCFHKCWLMAHSGSPQNVLGRSANSTASGFFCLLVSIIMIESFVRGWMRDPSLNLCFGFSDYGFSSLLVLPIQFLGVVIGTISPAYRWFNAVRLRRFHWKEEFKVDDCWIQSLNDWKEKRLPLFKIGNRRMFTKIARQIMRNWITFCIFLQRRVVQVSKVCRLISVVAVSIVCCCATLKSNKSPVELRPYVFYLEGEENLDRLISQSDDRHRKVDRESKKKKPLAVLELIEKHSTYRQGFTEVGVFDSGSLSFPDIQVQLPNSWALPIVTLAAIAAALRADNEELVQSLLLAIEQGLRYVSFIEKHLDPKGLMNAGTAADLVWTNVHMDNRWLDEQLTVKREERGTKALIERLRGQAIERIHWFMERSTQGLEKIHEVNPQEWPEIMLAAVCMERVCGSILGQYEGDNRKLAEWVRLLIADILGACLTNLPQCVINACFCYKEEMRGNSVEDAARVLAEADEVLKLLIDPELAVLWPEERQQIESWKRAGIFSFDSRSNSC